MPIDIADFRHDLFQDIVATSDAEGRYVEDAFFDHFCEYLVEAGELETADRALFQSSRGIRVDGYGGDPAAAGGVLSLLVADFQPSNDPGTLTGGEMDALFKRVLSFLTRSLDPSFRNTLEETSPGFGLADLIAQRWEQVIKVRLILISNRQLSTRIDGREAGEVSGVPVTYSVWDLGRLHRLASSGTGREDIRIDLAADFGRPLPALPAHLVAEYEAYIMVVPGEQLAAIYDRWGARLLEQNVRVFLQARGGVNKGIRNTIENEPEMFFAYNNGITATAEAVTTLQDANGLAITGLKNFQIVNGGQTTASIHAASRRKVDISRVFVQMKLSVVQADRAAEVVPRISEYANSQNRVSAADFFANHPFHVRIEEFSRRLFAPSQDGSFRESKWFYERARGQYQDARALLTQSQRAKFDLEYPKSQVISKTGLAKYLNSWRGHPDLVSKGSQKNFGEFAREVGSEWEKEPDSINEAFYRQAVAQSVIFRDTEKLVSAQPWYHGGGLRSRVVPYALAKLAYDADKRGRYVDFDRVWRAQRMPDDLSATVGVAAVAVYEVIVDESSGNPNPLEWAKQPACWTRAKALSIDWPDGWLNSFLTADQRTAKLRSATKDQRQLNGIEAQTMVLNAGADFWKATRDWGIAKELLSPTEADILALASSIPSRLPSEKQSIRLVETLRRLQAEGYQAGKDLA